MSAERWAALGVDAARVGGGNPASGLTEAEVVKQSNELWAQLSALLIEKHELMQAVEGGAPFDYLHLLHLELSRIRALPPAERMTHLLLLISETLVDVEALRSQVPT